MVLPKSDPPAGEQNGTCFGDPSPQAAGLAQSEKKKEKKMEKKTGDIA